MASVMSLGKFSVFGLAGCLFPGINPPTQAPSFQINHRNIFSNARSSHSDLTATLVWQGITLRLSRNHHLVPTALSVENSLSCCLPAGNKSKPPASGMDLPDKTNCNQKEISQANSPLQQKKTTQSPNEAHWHCTQIAGKHQSKMKTLTLHFHILSSY